MVDANSSALLSYFLKRDTEIGNAILKLKRLARAESDDGPKARIQAQIRHLEDKRSELDAEHTALKANLATLAPPSAEVVASLQHATAVLSQQIADAQTVDAILSAVTTAFTAWEGVTSTG
jgi:ABC-type transporter Mla subunit MlaD